MRSNEYKVNMRATTTNEQTTILMQIITTIYKASLCASHFRFFRESNVVFFSLSLFLKVAFRPFAISHWKFSFIKPSADHYNAE